MVKFLSELWEYVDQLSEGDQTSLTILGWYLDLILPHLEHVLLAHCVVTRCLIKTFVSEHSCSLALFNGLTLVELDAFVFVRVIHINLHALVVEMPSLEQHKLVGNVLEVWIR